jgi:hypothetical protein
VEKGFGKTVSLECSNAPENQYPRNPVNPINPYPWSTFSKAHNNHSPEPKNQ